MFIDLFVTLRKHKVPCSLRELLDLIALLKKGVALANAIDEFEGGVVLITHNKEFADATTRVTWVVANNKCDIKGDAEWEKYAAEQELIQQEQGDTMVDAAGNTVSIKKIKTIKEMSRAEIKKNKKNIRSKIKNGEELEEHEMDWADEWNIDF